MVDWLDPETAANHVPGAEVLCKEGPQRDVLPLLDVPRAPVVHEHHAEDPLVRRRHRDGVAEPVGGAADEEGGLELEVQEAAGAENGRCSVVRSRLHRTAEFIGWGLRRGLRDAILDNLIKMKDNELMIKAQTQE